MAVGMVAMVSSKEKPPAAQHIQRLPAPLETLDASALARWVAEVVRKEDVGNQNQRTNASSVPRGIKILHVKVF